MAKTKPTTTVAHDVRTLHALNADNTTRANQAFADLSGLYSKLPEVRPVSNALLMMQALLGSSVEALALGYYADYLRYDAMRNQLFDLICRGEKRRGRHASDERDREDHP